MKEFEEFIDATMLTPEEQIGLYGATLYMNNKRPQLRLKEIIDTVNAFKEHEKAKQLAPKGLSRAKRRAMEKEARKEGKRKG